MKPKQLIVFSLAVVCCSIACTKESNSEFTQIITEQDVEQLVLSEMTEVITKSGSSTAFDLAAMIQEYGDAYETVYPETIASEKATKSLTSLNRILLDEINSNVGHYPHLAALMGGMSKSADEVSLMSIPVEFYFPNSDSFNMEEEDYVTVAHQLPDTDEWTYGYRYSRDGSKEYVPMIDEDYLEQNMTILILPLDTTEYTEPMSDDELEADINEKKIVTKSTELNNGLITKNIYDSNAIREQDVLYTTISAIRADGTSWCGAISNKLKLAIYRASGDVDTNADGSLKASASCHKAILIPIPKSDLKDHNWKIGNYLFDDDWDLHEYDQKIYFVSEHNTGKGSANVEASVGIGYKDGKFSAEMGMKVSVEVVFEKHSIMRVNNQLVRKSMLATNMNDMGSGKYDGYAIRRYGIVDIVFNFYYTKID